MSYGSEVVLGSERFVPFGLQIQRLGLVLVLLFGHCTGPCCCGVQGIS